VYISGQFSAISGVPIPGFARLNTTPFRLVPGFVSSADALNLTILSPPPGNHELQVSSDLRNWVTIQNASGTNSFSAEQIMGSATNAFFRVVTF
jgi:hypothetical protein